MVKLHVCFRTKAVHRMTMKSLFICWLVCEFVTQDAVNLLNVFMSSQGLPAGTFPFILSLGNTSLATAFTWILKVEPLIKHYRTSLSFQGRTWRTILRYDLCGDNAQCPVICVDKVQYPWCVHPSALMFVTSECGQWRQAGQLQGRAVASCSGAWHSLTILQEEGSPI